MVVVNGEVDTGRVLIGWDAVADALGVKVSTARRWRRELALPVYKLGGQVRANEKDLRKWENEIRRIGIKSKK